MLCECLRHLAKVAEEGLEVVVEFQGKTYILARARKIRRKQALAAATGGQSKTFWNKTQKGPRYGRRGNRLCFGPRHKHRAGVFRGRCAKNSM